MAIRYYLGFNTKNYEKFGGGFASYNTNCIEQDLLNEIFTIRGERLYMPTFGTRIPTLTFEPNDAGTMDVIREDITTVMNNDPRVVLQDLSIIQLPDVYAILAIAKVNFLEFNVTKDLNIKVTSQ